jgi:aspartate aminotransferase
MPQISKRGQAMPASPIRKLVPYAEEAKKRGVKIYHLNIGQPDIKTPKQALDAVKNTNLEVLEYSHSAGFESYRRKLSAYYNGLGGNIDHNEILVTTGGSEAILMALMSCLDAGDEVIIPEPLYANYNGFTVAGGIVVKPLTTKIENGFALPSSAEFEAIITPKTKAIMICNPSNPTGQLYPLNELELLREICLKHDLFLFADEVYREFIYENNTFNSILSLKGMEEHSVVIDSISKRYSACGARIGALVTKNKDVLGAAMKFAQARLSPPTLEQILAEATLDVPQDYFKGVNEEYDKRRKYVIERLKNMEGVLTPTPLGAFYAFIRLPIDNSDKFCQWLLESFNLDGKTVMLAPGTGFYSTPGLGLNEVRIAYVLNIEDLTQAMNCLEAGLKAYKTVMAATV